MFPFSFTVNDMMHEGRMKTAPTSVQHNHDAVFDGDS